MSYMKKQVNSEITISGYLYASADLDAPVLETINGISITQINDIDRATFIKLTGACSEGVDDFIKRTGHESLPIAKLSRILTKENLYGAKTIAWIIKQQKILKGRK